MLAPHPTAPPALRALSRTPRTTSEDLRRSSKRQRVEASNSASTSATTRSSTPPAPTLTIREPLAFGFRIVEASQCMAELQRRRFLRMMERPSSPTCHECGLVPALQLCPTCRRPLCGTCVHVCMNE